MICTMTGLVIVVTGVYDKTDPVHGELFARLIDADKDGAATDGSKALERRTVSWFPWVLCVAVILFCLLHHDLLVLLRRTLLVAPVRFVGRLAGLSSFIFLMFVVLGARGHGPERARLLRL